MTRNRIVGDDSRGFVFPALGSVSISASRQTRSDHPEIICQAEAAVRYDLDQVCGSPSEFVNAAGGEIVEQVVVILTKVWAASG